MRILISYEDSYLLYSDTLERALGGLRPEAAVAACRLRVLGEQVKSFNPLSSCRVAKQRGSGRAGGLVQALSRARQTVRGLSRRAALAEVKPNSGRPAVVHRGSRGACSQWGRTRRLLVCRGCSPYSPECVEGDFFELRPKDIA